MARLRGPKGCPWDREQNHRTILRCLIEEAYEFYEAALDNDPAAMCEELGDLMLQIVFHAQMAAEKRRFSMDDVLRSISDKLERRHPHVFGSAVVKDSGQVISNWERIKRNEPHNRRRVSLLDGIPAHMPAVLKAFKIQKRVGRAGFDWKDTRGIFDKIGEETGELRAAVRSGRAYRIRDELGDLLFSVVNLARKLDIDPEEALALTNKKFSRRFKGMEVRIARDGKKLERMSLAEMDTYWDKEKRRDAKGDGR
ncbi:MAG: nucleoside triphosphate pyrophosphohydrolase [Candidatus Raymondbacteria bacterium RifOxyC12_full_50_8]|uniref:Nucleoside triphosphate pyrophosphohydrolase n=1 Tax=Candidatus Raymondbacteria bacterium RIFOXYD12_FULL_49_13 TaxID=1817890 RepID=A0A1F7FIT6_UNCRA|nr:MAG: nucleoside triphosphate pyrophosphohydrolase [Candidatus Raymondbacteria bacterium RIFOXYA2_FULL_49_16]OGJ94705.1 MAG: nucleoside triphosphate pyrophosphohydrolase [Candidatus Raymondbacteria bacterium RifOxyB12_full_50_8]OGK01284.1 MAG: nucleoside triphosphate pyrophosphohydrolase [Candidatus Raymondbacteria bacterium RifOxyC12_full_50_8]OGK06372.1 MAG: nucleoside triphosphate pyrophosphohydrolase [Candidatus Raymondbacteria bacterium RIFOXYD12_FULL_49_13]OGP40706.1 MAG: nucleoside tri